MGPVSPRSVPPRMRDQWRSMDPVSPCSVPRPQDAESVEVHEPSVLMQHLPQDAQGEKKWGQWGSMDPVSPRSISSRMLILTFWVGPWRGR